MALVDDFFNPVAPSTITVDGNTLDRSVGFIGSDILTQGQNAVSGQLSDATQGWAGQSEVSKIVNSLFLGDKTLDDRPMGIPPNVTVDMVKSIPISSVIITAVELTADSVASEFDPASITGGEVTLTNENGETAGALQTKLDQFELDKALGTASSFVSELISGTFSEITDLNKKQEEIDTTTAVSGVTQNQEAAMGGNVTDLDAFSVRLPMPSDISNTTKQDWSGGDTASIGADIYRKTSGVVDDVGSSKGTKAKASTVARGVNGEGINTDAAQKKMLDGLLGSVLGQNAKNLSQLKSQKIENSKQQVLYRGHDFRTFTFKFEFIPRNQKEVFESMAIIKGLKYFSSPDMVQNEQFLTYPSLFKIQFMNKMGSTASEDFGMKIGKCAMTSMDVNYTPDGLFQTFKNGFPVHVTMTLTFQETELLYRSSMAGAAAGQFGDGMY